MTTRDALTADLEKAIRAGDEGSKRTLRLAISAIHLAEVEQRGELDEAGIQAVLQKEIKSRRETISDAQLAGRPDLVAEAEREIADLQAYLPPPLSQEALEGMAAQAILETGAESPGDIGKVMKVLMPQVQGMADGAEVNRVVRRLLAGN